MRPILLVMLVAYHAFAPYVGTWSLPDGIHDVRTYWWLGWLSRAFRLEGFVFISGYIFTFQLIEKQKFPTFGSLLSSKIQRLMIPSIVFSAIYFVCFNDYENVGKFCYAIVSGVGHLWYLPCLFVCFLVQWLLLRYKTIPLPTVLCVVVLAFMAAASFIPLPFRLNKPMYYMIFFYGGGLFWQNSKYIHEKATKGNTLMAWVLFVLCFIGLTLTMEHLDAARATVDNRIMRAINHSLTTVLKLIMGWTGIVALYLTAVRYCKNHALSDTVIKIGACGYGVYVIHQFILVYLYRYTNLPAVAGTYLLPWVGFIITVVLSTVLTLLIRRTSLGRKYL